VCLLSSESEHTGFLIVTMRTLRRGEYPFDPWNREAQGVIGRPITCCEWSDDSRVVLTMSTRQRVSLHEWRNHAAEKTTPAETPTRSGTSWSEVLAIRNSSVTPSVHCNALLPHDTNSPSFLLSSSLDPLPPSSTVSAHCP